MFVSLLYSILCSENGKPPRGWKAKRGERKEVMIDCTDTEEVVCPHCSMKYTVSPILIATWLRNSEKLEIIACKSCKKKFAVVCSILFATWKE